MKTPREPYFGLEVASFLKMAGPIVIETIGNERLTDRCGDVQSVDKNSLPAITSCNRASGFHMYLWLNGRANAREWHGCEFESHQIHWFSNGSGGYSEDNSDWYSVH